LPASEASRISRLDASALRKPASEVPVHPASVEITILQSAMESIDGRFPSVKYAMFAVYVRAAISSLQWDLLNQGGIDASGLRRCFGKLKSFGHQRGPQ